MYGFQNKKNLLVHAVSIPAIALQSDNGRRIFLLVADLERQIRPEFLRILDLNADVLDEFLDHHDIVDFRCDKQFDLNI